MALQAGLAGVAWRGEGIFGSCRAQVLGQVRCDSLAGAAIHACNLFPTLKSGGALHLAVALIA